MRFGPRGPSEDNRERKKPRVTMASLSSSSSSQNAEEEVTPESDVAFEEVNSHIDEAFNILKRETVKLRRERDAFESVAKKIKHAHFSKTLKLNVGGQFFSTSLDTIMKDPGSMLHAMFSCRFDTKPSEDGSYFIDRDGTHFRYILNYLRTGQLVIPEDKLLKRELLAEAEFYQIEGIIDEMKACPFESSCILSTEQRQTLISWFKGTLTSLSHSYSLIYRASRDGWNASTFHSRCDCQGPTVIVVKSGNYIFGGYTERDWESVSGGIYRRSPESFLFSLVNQSGLGPMKMPLITGKEGSAIYCHSSFGPVFGKGNDLQIVNSPNSSYCNTSLNTSYQLPAGQNATTFLTGRENYYLSEMEVFRFENIHI